MSRNFRYYGKKRNNRRTGSPMLASAGETVFFALFLIMGCVGIVWLLLHLALPEWRVHQEFVETTCKVLDKRIEETQGEDGLLYAPGIKVEYAAGGEITTWSNYDIHRSRFDGREDAQAVLNRFGLYAPELDNRYPCWYDPTDSYVVVLVREYRWWIWLALTVPISFVAIGAGGLIYSFLHWGKSAERRAAMTQRGQERDLFGAGGNGDRRYPFVPQGADMTNSPGTRLRFRLPMASSPGWMLFGTLLFCAIWNGIVAVFVAIAVGGHLAGRPDWFLTVFIVPFVLIGLAAIAVFLRQLLVATGTGPTLLEISGHPLEPGGQYRLFLSQSGRLSINALRVSLACEEVATYRQGTNTRTETREVHRQELFCREGFEIQSGLPFQTEFELNVPRACMHSFKADHNEINWSVKVEGDVAGWPDYNRSFTVVVRPNSGDARQ